MTKNKKYLIAIFTTILFLGLAINLSQKFELEKVKIKELKVGGDRNYPPYEYIDKETGEYVGFNVDLMREISLETGVKIKFYPMKWDEALEKLESGEIDLIQGIEPLEERKSKISFSNPYIENSQSIFALESSDIKDEKSLSKKLIAVQKADATKSIIKDSKSLKFLEVDDQEEALKKMISKEADLYLGNTLTGVRLVEEMGERNNIRIIGETIGSIDYCIGVKKGNIEVLNLMNKSLSKIKRNGTYDKIYTKWFGHEPTIPKSIISNWSKIIILIAALWMLVVIITLRGNRVLENAVKRQTTELEEKNNELSQRNIEIQEERDFRENILNSIYNAVISFDDSGKINFLNQKFEKIFEDTKRNLIGKDISKTPYYIFKQNLMEDTYKMNIRDKSVVLGWNTRAIEGKEHIVIIRDLTKERKIQENLLRKDRVESLGSLVSSIAHEIRNPLAAIQSYVQLIPLKLEDEHFREILLREVPKEVDRLNGLIRDILEYSNPRKSVKSRIHLKRELQRIINLLKSQIERDKINLIVDISYEGYILFDRNHFRQILFNILLNAFDSFEGENREVSLLSIEKDDRVILKISDTGIGIEKEYLRKIFDPFYTTKEKGTGLGLFVVHGLVEENGGNISLQSEVNQGTDFFIGLPKYVEDREC